MAVLGASNYSFAEATHTQRVHDFVGSHVRAFAFFEGVGRAVVPDNLKSGVTRACIYEPTIQRSYQHMAEHYGTAILPARARKPRDKAKVEGAVRIVQRWVLGRLRNRVFHSLTDLNAAIRECVDDLNRRRMRTYGKSRLEMFEAFERATLLPLPRDHFEITEWKKAKVNIDYHVEFDGRLYSVPYRHVGEEVWIRATPTAVEVLLGNRRIAAHARNGSKRVSTLPDHMPSAHRAHAEWTPSRILSWASKLGPETNALCAAILSRDLAAREEVRRRPRGGRVRALYARRRALVSERRVGAPTWPRRGRDRRPRRRHRDPHRPRERARSGLLPELRTRT